MRSQEILRAAGALAGGSRHRGMVAALGAIGAVALAIGIVLVLGAPESSKGASQSAIAAGAAMVQRRDLVSTDTESGTLGYANPQTVFNRLTGTVTWLPSVGQVIKTGQTLYEVDGAPVVLLNGSFPAYRDLSPGDSKGRDVLELNQNLVKLGFADGEITVNDTRQIGTTDAVERWQASLGETETGTISLGQVVFLPGDQQIALVNTVLGSDGASDAGGSGPSVGGSSQSSGAGGASAASAILETSSKQLIVTVDLDATKQREAVLGEPVTVEMPDASTVGGKITGVSPIAQSSASSSSGSGAGSGSSSGASATIPVTITLTGHHRARGLDHAAVSVNFQQQVADNVLSVPVTALLATAGGYAVQEAAAPHKLIPVTTGLFAAGFVQITSPGIYPGLQVTDSQG